MADPEAESPDPSLEPTVAGGAAGEGTVAWSAVPPPLRLPPGQLLAGRFRIVRFIGQGGMGDVYEAEDRELRERVALKTVRPEIACVPGALERFTREIHLARKVTHPNVCRIFDISHDGPVTFLTMELLAGETLEARLRREGTIREEEALPLIRQMAEGLAAAHRVGVVHRDFKPANVMLVPEDGGVRAVVTDFGLAHSAEPVDHGLTLRGDILGTPSYMAPEQVSDGAVTPFTDIYTFGIVLYEMVTGTVPFRGDTPLSTAVKRLKEPPPPPRLTAPHLDPAWEKAILRCLSVEPRDRFGGVREVVAALEAPAPEPAPPPRPAPWRRWIVAAALVVLAAGALAFWRFRHPAEPTAGRLPLEISSGSLPADPAARDLYKRGREALSHYDAARARDLLKRAIAAEPGFPLAHSALAEAWSRLGYSAKAAAEAKQARDALPGGLGAAERSLVQARYWETAGRWDQAVEIYRSLRKEFPHDLDYGLGIAQAQVRAGQGKAALQVVAELKQTADDPQIDLVEAQAAYSLSQFAPARAAAEQARRKAEKIGSRSLAARALIEEARACSSQQDYPGALAALRDANAIYQDTGDLRGLATVTGTRAVLLYRQHDLAGAQKGFDEALGIYRQVQDRGGEAAQLNGLASVLGEQGHPAEAARQYQELIQVYRDIGNREGEARALGNLGLALSDQGKLAEAVPRLQDALKAFAAIGNRQEQANVLLNLGTLYESQPDLGHARASYEQALKLADEIGDQDLYADTAHGLGSVLAAQGELEEAYEKFQSELEVRSRLQEDAKISDSRLALAEILLEQGVLGQAASFADKAAEAARKAQDPDREAEAAALLARIEIGRKDAGRARAALDRAESLAAKNPSPALHGDLALAAGPVLAAEGKTGDAVRRLEAAIADQRKAGQVRLELELRLTLGEIEAAHGDRAKGRAILQAVEKDARQHGLGLIAGKAAKALGK